MNVTYVKRLPILYVDQSKLKFNTERSFSIVVKSRKPGWSPANVMASTLSNFHTGGHIK